MHCKVSQLVTRMKNHYHVWKWLSPSIWYMPWGIYLLCILPFQNSVITKHFFWGATGYAWGYNMDSCIHECMMALVHKEAEWDCPLPEFKVLFHMKERHILWRTCFHFSLETFVNTLDTSMIGQKGQWSIWAPNGLADRNMLDSHIEESTFILASIQQQRFICFVSVSIQFSGRWIDFTPPDISCSGLLIQ